MGLIDNVNVNVGGNGNIIDTLSTYVTKVLKPNIINGKNILSQGMMPIDTGANTKYVIKYNYELSENITVPENCILEFDGGSISGKHTITGNNTGISSNTYSIFGFDIDFGGTWKVEKVLLNWFATDANGYWNNALYKAIKYFRNVTCVAHSKYLFDDTVIDLRSSYEKFHLDGCMSWFVRLHLSYDIGPDNNWQNPNGSVGGYEIIIENIYFIGSKQNNIPIIHTAHPFKLLNCNFAGMNVALGIAPTAIDHIAYENGYIWDTKQFIACYNYNIEPEVTSNYIADFFFFKNVLCDTTLENGEEHIFIEFKNTGGLHALFENCLHPRFKVSIHTNNQCQEYKITFINCHFENTASLIESNTTINDDNYGVEFDFYNCYLNASALPYKNWLERCVFENCEIQNVSNGNIGQIDYNTLMKVSPKNLTIIDFAAILKYDTYTFNKDINDKIPNAVCTASQGSYYISVDSFTGLYANLNYTEGFTAKYFIGLSQRYDELYNDEATPTVVWSNDVVVPVGKVVRFDMYLQTKHAAYLHIYKIVDGVTYRVVVPFTKEFSFGRYNGNILAITDCNKGVFGVAWTIYEGTVKYMKTLVEKSRLGNTTIGTNNDGRIVAELQGHYIDVYKNISGGDLSFNLAGKANLWAGPFTLSGIFENNPTIGEIATSVERVNKSEDFNINIVVPNGKYIGISENAYSIVSGGSCTITYKET